MGGPLSYICVPLTRESVARGFTPGVARRRATIGAWPLAAAECSGVHPNYKRGRGDQWKNARAQEDPAGETRVSVGGVVVVVVGGPGHERGISGAQTRPPVPAPMLHAKT